MKNNKLLSNTLTLLMLCLFIFQSCTKDTIEQENASIEIQKQTLIVTSVVKKLLEMGYGLEDIVELPDFYLVDGDLRFSKNIKDYSESQNNSRTHYQASTLVSDDNITIRVFANIAEPPGIPAGTSWNLAIDDAIGDWNVTRAGCSDLFVRSFNINQTDIIIQGPENIDGGWPPGATHIFGWVNGNPSCGEPFPEVFINTNYRPNGNFPTQRNMRNIVGHELGHAIGFRHTDGNEGIAIPGTNGTDSNSIMNGDIITRQSLGLSTQDITATEYLYGCNSNANDNQNTASSIDITSISPNPFCVTDVFTVNGTFNTCSSTGSTIELCFIESNGALSFPICIESGYFTNGTFSFTGLSLSDIPNFNLNSEYFVSAKITGMNSATSFSVQVPFITNCNTGCLLPELSIVNDPMLGRILSWDNPNNETYTMEFEVSYECAGYEPNSQLDGVIYTITTSINFVSFFDIQSNALGRAWKFRMRKEGCLWSTQCCLSYSTVSDSFLSPCVTN